MIMMDIEEEEEEVVAHASIVAKQVIGQGTVLIQGKVLLRFSKERGAEGLAMHGGQVPLLVVDFIPGGPMVPKDEIKIVTPEDITLGLDMVHTLPLHAPTIMRIVLVGKVVESEVQRCMEVAITGPRVMGGLKKRRRELRLARNVDK